MDSAPRGVYACLNGSSRGHEYSGRERFDLALSRQALELPLLSWHLQWQFLVQPVRYTPVCWSYKQPAGYSVLPLLACVHTCPAPADQVGGLRFCSGISTRACLLFPHAARSVTQSAR